MILIILSISACFQGLLFIYYKYKTIHYINSIQNTNILYINSYIPLIPSIVNILMLIKYIFNQLDYTYLIDFFIVEWCISTPLLMISLSSIKRVNPIHYISLTVLCSIINISGYISYRYYLDEYMRMAYTFFGVGCTFYLALSFYLYYIYIFNPDIVLNTSNYIIINNNKLYKILMLFTYLLWAIYPIVFGIYISNIVSLEYTILGFTILDFISKGGSTYLVIGYEIAKINNSDIMSYVVQKITRIHPMPIPSTVPEPGECEYTLSEVPNITDTNNENYTIHNVSHATDYS